MKKAFSMTTKVLAIILLIAATLLPTVKVFASLLVNAWSGFSEKESLANTFFIITALVSLVGLIAWFETRRQIVLTVTLLLSVMFMITAELVFITIPGIRTNFLIGALAALMLLVGVADIIASKVSVSRGRFS